jgi:D-alanyl-D-alanine carboxypeptidase
MKNTYFWLLLFCSSSLFSQVTDASFEAVYAQKLSNILQSQGASNGLYGLSAAVFVPGQGQWIGTFGNSSAGQSVTSDQRFCIASNSKSFIAVLCLKLQEEGLLSLDDSIGKYLPTFIHLDPRITIRQCLMHQSGLADFYNDISDATYNEFASHPDSIWSPSDVLKTMPSPIFDAGMSFYYSNTNYVVAGMCCAVAANQSLGFLLKNRIFEPLSLTKTVYAGDGTPFWDVPWAVLRTSTGTVGLQANHANGFNSFIQSAGAIWSTAAEEVRWYRAIFAENFLTAASQKQLRATEPWSSYALGVRAENSAGGSFRYHAGAWGYRSILYFDEKTGITVSVLSNLQGKSMASVGVKLMETALAERPRKDIDTRLVKIVAPIGNVCKADTLSFFLQNNGLQTTDLLQIHVEIDGNTVFDAPLTLTNFFANQTRKIKIPLQTGFNLEGLHQMLVEVRVPGIVAQGYQEDDVQMVQFYGHSGVGASPNNISIEQFDGSNGDLPLGWISHQTKEVQDWSTSHFTGDGGALCRQNQNDGNENESFLLDLPSINTTNLSAASIFTFDYAYALYAGYPNTDTLEVLISADCGLTFKSIWKKGGSNLTTANAIAASFLPNQNQWQSAEIPFNPTLMSSENTVFRFKVWNGYGNNIWLDKVGFQGITNLSTPVEESFQIAPNPMKSTAEIRFATNMQAVNVQILDVLGRKVKQIKGFSGQTLILERQGLPTGMYVFLVEKNGLQLAIGKLEMVD